MFVSHTLTQIIFVGSKLVSELYFGRKAEERKVTKQYARNVVVIAFQAFVIVDGRDSSVVIANYYELDGPGIESKWE
jgi:hypothetical protein